MNAPLEKGSPSWSDILTKTWEEIEAKASAGNPFYRTFRKLLTGNEYKK